MCEYFIIILTSLLAQQSVVEVAQTFKSQGA